MKIISGGQTGVDRAALDAAISCGLPYGGAIPKGRLTEAGPLDRNYDQMTELPSASYPTRTAQNVADAAATLIITTGSPDRGTALTIALAGRYGRPCLTIDMDLIPDTQAVECVCAWLSRTAPDVLNVAGPRESRFPGIYARTRRILTSVFLAWKGAPHGGTES